MPVPVIAAKFAAIAFWMLRRPATSTIRAIRDGTLMDTIAPSMKEPSRMCHKPICPVKIRNASDTATHA